MTRVRSRWTDVKPWKWVPVALLYEFFDLYSDLRIRIESTGSRKGKFEGQPRGRGRRGSESWS